MKKLIVFLLLAIMCLSFVACGNEAKKEIVGTWVRKNTDESFAFNEDGSGIFDNRSSDEIRWKYDEELSRYIFCNPDGDVGHFDVKTDENGERYFEYWGVKYYYQDK